MNAKTNKVANELGGVAAFLTVTAPNDGRPDWSAYMMAWILMQDLGIELGDIA